MKDIIIKALVVPALGGVTALAARHPNPANNMSTAKFCNLTLAVASVTPRIADTPFIGNGSATTIASCSLGGDQGDQKITAAAGEVVELTTGRETPGRLTAPVGAARFTALRRGERQLTALNSWDSRAHTHRLKPSERKLTLKPGAVERVEVCLPPRHPALRIFDMGGAA